MKIPDNPLELPVLFRGLAVKELRVLDLGSGRLDSPLSTHMRELPFKQLTLVEGWMRSYRVLFNLRASKQLAAQECTVILADAWKIIQHEPDGMYDVVTLLDIVEHFPKDIAISILNKAQTLANKRVLVWIPIGVCPQEDLEGNPLQVHQSVWEVEELEQLGFQVRVYKDYHTHFSPHVSAAWAIWNRQEAQLKEEAPEQYKFHYEVVGSGSAGGIVLVPNEDPS